MAAAWALYKAVVCASQEDRATKAGDVLYWTTVHRSSVRDVQQLRSSVGLEQQAWLHFREEAAAARKLIDRINARLSEDERIPVAHLSLPPEPAAVLAAAEAEEARLQRLLALLTRP